MFFDGLIWAFAFFGGVFAVIVTDYVPGNIIGQNDSRHTAPILKGMHMAAQEVFQCLVKEEL